MKNSTLKNILVLGSEGQIGKPLCNYLSNKNIKVYNLDIKNHPEQDLRKKQSLLNYWIDYVDFVFFLAYDIGGSKFLAKQQLQSDFMFNNMKIMENVFSVLKKTEKPFIFASSTMAEMPWSTYGSLKRVGEHFTKALGGITVRFWNVYGPETDEDRAHVITDFIRMAKNENVIRMLTDGLEARQFLHADDCSKILLSLAKNYQQTRKYGLFDVSSFQWTEINTIATIIAKHYNVNIIRPEKKDIVQNDSRLKPNKYPLELFWNVDNVIDIEEGIQKMINYYEEFDG